MQTFRENCNDYYLWGITGKYRYFKAAGGIICSYIPAITLLLMFGPVAMSMYAAGFIIISYATHPSNEDIAKLNKLASEINKEI